MYGSQRQINVPGYAYCVAPSKVSYLYGIGECIGQLVLKHIGGSINDRSCKHESAVSQCCRVSLLD